MKNQAERIIDEDIKRVYLGNLNTVEFDLKLPSKGEKGSKITWSSDNELFLRPDGTITRPYYGIGNRKVHLCGKFEFGGKVKEKIYEVHILEEPCKAKIQEVLPIKRKVQVGKKVVLPMAVVVKAENGHRYSRRVQWEGGNEQEFEECGQLSIDGNIDGENLKAKLYLEIQEQEVKEYEKPLKQVRAMDHGETKLLPGSMFYDAMQKDYHYLKHINDDQMLYNFRIAAGLDTKGVEGLNGWDSSNSLIRGHTTGHYLSALALCFRETGDPEIKEKINYMVDELGVCQQTFSKKAGFKEGYIGAYDESQFDLLEKGEVYPNIWAPYYTLHKILAGLMDIYTYVYNAKALKIAEASAMWVYRRLSALDRETRVKMWDSYIAGEFGGMNETMSQLYEITGKEEFKETALMFENDKLCVPLLEKEDALEGMHANQHIPQVLGLLEYYYASEEKKYREMAEFFWDIVTKAHSFANGGAGENEMFFEANSPASHLTRETAEYCVSYNMLKLTKELYQLKPNVAYMDYYERALFNHIVAGYEGGENGDTTYFYPLAPGSRKDIKYENSCCHGTGMESQMKYSESIFYRDKDTLYINLFVDSELNGDNFKVSQNVDKHNPGKIHIHIEGKEFDQLKVRCPYWCNGKLRIMAKNGNIIAKCGKDGYINVYRTEFENDVYIEFFCSLRIERACDNQQKAVLFFGPYILAAISDKETFLELDVKNQCLSDIWKRGETETGTDIQFWSDEGEKIQWIPLAKTGKARHHVYWKMK